MRVKSSVVLMGDSVPGAICDIIEKRLTSLRQSCFASRACDMPVWSAAV